MYIVFIGVLGIAHVKIYLTGKNIFDEDYEEALGYETPGAAVYGGVRIEL